MMNYDDNGLLFCGSKIKKIQLTFDSTGINIFFASHVVLKTQPTADLQSISIWKNNLKLYCLTYSTMNDQI